MALLSIFKKIQRILPIILPLFLASLRRAETLVLAMEARCYTGGKGRTHLVRFDASWRDVVVIVSAVLVLGLLLLLEGIEIDRLILNRFITQK